MHEQNSTVGKVIWITGLSCSGKTTLALSVRQEFRSLGHSAIVLDGDEFRRVIDDKLGHSLDERLINARRLTRMCALLSEQGIVTICATMSLFPEVWEENRRQLKDYFEVYLRVDDEVLRARDKRGIYNLSAASTRNVIGQDLEFNEPTKPDLIIDNADATPDEIRDRARQIVALTYGRGRQ